MRWFSNPGLARRPHMPGSGSDVGVALGESKSVMSMELLVAVSPEFWTTPAGVAVGKLQAAINNTKPIITNPFSCFLLKAFMQLISISLHTDDTEDKLFSKQILLGQTANGRWLLSMNGELHLTCRL